MRARALAQDPLSGRSLASRVCAEEPGLEIAADQMSSHGVLAAYLEPLGLGMQTGPLMCGLALLVWCLSIVKELQACASLARGILGLPRAAATTLRIGREEGSCGLA